MGELMLWKKTVERENMDRSVHCNFIDQSDSNSVVNSNDVCYNRNKNTIIDKQLGYRLAWRDAGGTEGT